MSEVALADRLLILFEISTYLTTVLGPKTVQGISFFKIHSEVRNCYICLRIFTSLMINVQYSSDVRVCSSKRVASAT